MITFQLWSTLIRYGISPDQLYFLDCCRTKIKPTSIIDEFLVFKECRDKGFISDERILSQAALDLLDEFETFLIKTKKKVTAEVLGSDFIEKVNEYRELFPKGRFPSGELARQNVQELKDKFVWFFKTFPEYNWELVLDATDYYLFMKQKVSYQYAITSSYFIKKTDPRSKETKSTLADYCQMIKEDPSILSN